MNLKILSTNVMLAQSGEWLTDSAVRGPIDRHALGQALLAELRKTHDRLALLADLRRKYEAALARLTKLITAADLRHDRKARALNAALQGLIDAEDDADVRELYLAVLAILFPEGLAIVTRSFSYQAGAIQALEMRMTPEIMAQLESLHLGPYTLASLYLDWVAAGKDLGKLVAQRARLLDRAGHGSATEDIDIRAARAQWIGVVHAFVSALSLMELTPAERGAVLNPLEDAIDRALRSRAPGDELPGDELPGDGDDIEVAPVPGDGDDVVVAPAPGDGDDVVVAPAPGDGDVIAPPAGALAAPAAPADEIDPPASA